MEISGSIKHPMNQIQTNQCCRRARLTIFVLVVIGFYIVSSLTSLHLDDFNYKFIFAPEDLREVSQLWPHFSWYTDYFSGVSRFIPHLLVGFFTDITGKTVFNIFSTAAFIMLCYIISAIATENRATRISLMLMTAALIWFVVRGFFEGFLWMAGVCNYMFVAVIVLYFYRCLTSDLRVHRGLLWLPLYFVFGFITGWTNEGFIIGLSGATFIYYILLHRGLLDSRRIALLSGLWSGTLCLCLTPFNIFRFMLGHKDVTDMSGNIKNILSAVLSLDDIHTSFLLVSIAAMSVLCRVVNLKGLGSFIKRNLILVMAWGISLAFVIVTGYTNSNSRTPSEIYALVILIRFVADLFPQVFIRRMGTGLGLVVLLSFVFIMPDCMANFKTHTEMRKQIEEGRELVVIDNIKGNRFTSRYFSPVLLSMYREPIPVSIFPVRYYGGVPGTLILSTSIVDMLKGWNPDMRFKQDEDIGSLWIRNTGCPVPEKVRLDMRAVDVDSLGWIERAMSGFLSRYSMTEYETDVFVTAEILGEEWIVLRNYPYISDRITDVSLIYPEM